MHASFTADTVHYLLEHIPGKRIAVVGDLFLDRYLDIDPSLTEKSLETGLDAYQVVRVRPVPGAAGTIVNNLVALGVRHVYVLSCVGDDGEGYELRRELQRLDLHCDYLVTTPGRPTPTYTKPLVWVSGASPRELHRLDIRPRTRLAPEWEGVLLSHVHFVWPRVDAVIVQDQVVEENVGVVTAQVRDLICHLAERSDQIVLADSRARIHRFRQVMLKPNRAECLEAARALVQSADRGSAASATSCPSLSLQQALRLLARQAGKPVFCTCGEQGIAVCDPQRETDDIVQAPAYPVSGPIDPVGAGDSVNAALVSALACGAMLWQAACFANLVASITVSKLGTTGTASPEEIRRRWEEVQHAQLSAPGSGLGG